MKKLFVLLAIACAFMFAISCDELELGDKNGNGVEAITFTDDEVKQICIANWDTNEDGELSHEEAAAITDLGDAFKGAEISSFDELQHFTSLKTIAESAFYGCSSLTSVTIPDSVTEIGRSAFYGCSSLTSITIPDSVTSIGQAAFDGCISLTSITIPDNVIKIGYGVFRNCSSMKSFSGKFASDDNRCLIVDGALNSFAPAGLTTYTIPYRVTSIENSAFYKCSSLTSITIPDSVTEIGSSAFYKCSSLTSITIPDSVTEIGSSAFFGCSSLTSVTIPDSVTEIGWTAFSYCSSLTSITIPDSVTSIGQAAFDGCISLTSITIPDSVTSIGSAAFSDCSSLTSFYGKFASDDNRCLIVNGKLNSFAPANLTTYSMPDSVTSIGSAAFYGCRSLTSITIPDSVTKIEWSAFSHCSSLTSITIPDSVTSIGQDAFSYCSSLTSVTIGDSVTSIEEYAFYGCRSLTSVYCKPTTPPEIGEGVFINHSPDLTIFVPKGCATKYKAQWSEWENMIAENNGNNDDVAENQKIYYTATEKVEPNETASFGANIVSNDFDPNTGKGIIIFDNIVTEVGKEAFRDYYNLTSITIGDSVTSIGDYAFSYCSSLTSIYCEPTTPPSLGVLSFDNNASDRKI